MFVSVAVREYEAQNSASKHRSLLAQIVLLQCCLPIMMLLLFRDTDLGCASFVAHRVCHRVGYPSCHFPPAMMLSLFAILDVRFLLLNGTVIVIVWAIRRYSGRHFSG